MTFKYSKRKDYYFRNKGIIISLSIVASIMTLYFSYSYYTSRPSYFYTYYAEEDLYRVPLIAPHQMTSLYGIEEDESLFKFWEIHFAYGGDKNTSGFNAINNPGYQPRVGATEVNVSNGIIYGHNEDMADYPAVWFVIIPREKIEMVFKDRENDWRQYLKKKGVDSIQLYPVWPLFREFKKSYTLPWCNPDKHIYPVHN
jgi:hypothetical protein